MFLSTCLWFIAGSITSLSYTKDGRLYASGSKDGTIKIWDGQSNRCVQTIQAAHDGTQINSVTFSKNGKYILSSGKDALVKLWEVSAVRPLMYYAGAGGQVINQSINRLSVCSNADGIDHLIQLSRRKILR